MQSQPMISVIAPMFNEEKVIGVFIERTLTVLKQHYTKFELLLVDDGSTDSSYEICKRYAEKNSEVRLLAFTRNYGHEIALTAGIEHAYGDYIVHLDCDLQHSPEFIPQLVAKAEEGYDIVYAARINRDGQSWLKRITAKLFYQLARKMTGLDLPDDAGNFRVINRKVANSIMQLKENNRHLLMLYTYTGYKMTSLPCQIEKRLAGKTKYNYAKLVNLALDSIISFSHGPLRAISILSVMIALILACYAGFILLQKLLSYRVLIDGMASLIFILSGLFAILFIFLAILSEYIGRILIESKNRPLYYIREQYNSEKSNVHNSH